MAEFIRHDGSGMPVAPGTICEMVADAPSATPSGATTDRITGPAICPLPWSWAVGPQYRDGFLVTRIIWYRVVTPRGMEMLKRIAASPAREAATDNDRRILAALDE